MKVSTMNEDVVIRLKPDELNAIILSMQGKVPNPTLLHKIQLQLQCVKELL
jgi:hypothetical protein